MDDIIDLMSWSALVEHERPFLPRGRVESSLQSFLIERQLMILERSWMAEAGPRGTFWDLGSLMS